MPHAQPDARGLRRIASTLRRLHGRPDPPISRDPFRLIVWEQVAYLVDDARRLAAYRALERRVGLRPDDILKAPTATLGAITRMGGAIGAAVRVQRLRQTAAMTVDRWDGALASVLRLPTERARKELARFAMIGEPGADKILVFTGRLRQLALDSNALRVLQRLGVVAEGPNYRASYRRAQATLAPALPDDSRWLVDASHVLRTHGQTICRRSAPACGDCPLARACPSAHRVES
jgi:endonuclease III